MKLLSDLPRNARYSIMLEPMCAIFGAMLAFYAPLYMKGIGLNNVEIGMIATINMSVAFVSQFLAGPITNKFGRKRTTLIFELIAWSVPLFIWAIALNFWYFVVAGSISATVKIAFVSWNCLIIEDVEESKRAKVYAAAYICIYITGLFTPVVGLIIAKYGTVASLRVLYLIAVLSMTSMFFIRNHLVNETKAGIDLMRKHAQMSLAMGLKNCFMTVVRLCRNKSMIMIVTVQILTSFISSINGFQVIFLKEQLLFNEKDISLIPAIGAVINIFLFVIMLRRTDKQKEEKTLFLSLVLCAVGSLFFLIIPKGSLMILLLVITMLNVGNFLVSTHRDAIFMNEVGEHEKADMLSGVQALTTFVCIPSGYLSGLLYNYNPILPFAVILCLFAVTLFISLRLMLRKA